MRSTTALCIALLAGCQSVPPAPPAATAEPTVEGPSVEGPAIGIVMTSGEARPSAETRDGSLDSVVLASGTGEVAWVVAADTQFGLRIYALDGEEVSAFGVGRLSAVDAVRVADNEYVLAASNASMMVLSLFLAAIDDGVLTVTTLPPVALVDTRPNALCMERVADRLGIYVADRSGSLQEWHIDAQGAGTLARTLTFAGEVRACVVDRENRTLYVSDEANGIWALDLASNDLHLVDGHADQKLLPGASGLGIHASSDGRFLVASGLAGQGVGVYAVQSGEPLAAFRVNPNAELGMDGMPTVSGISVFGEAVPGYPEGIVIVHDGSGNERSFKVIDWRAVKLLLED